jgi:DNA-binding Lrp family transcriptional regulator
MDKIEKKLLCCLRKNGRMGFSEISRHTGIPTTTIFDRMQDFKYIKSTAALLNFERLGFGIRAFMTVRGSDKEALEQFMLSNASINSLCKINNGLDFFCEAVFRSIGEFELFNDTLQLLNAKARVFFVVEELRKEHMFSQKGHFRLI